MLETKFEPLGGNEYEKMKDQMEEQNTLLEKQ